MVRQQRLTFLLELYQSFLSISAKVVRLAEVLAPGLVPRVGLESVVEMVPAQVAALGLEQVPQAALAPAEVWVSGPVEVLALEQAPWVAPGPFVEMVPAQVASWDRVSAEVLVLEQAPGAALGLAVLAILGCCS